MKFAYYTDLWCLKGFQTENNFEDTSLFSDDLQRVLRLWR